MADETILLNASVTTTLTLIAGVTTLMVSRYFDRNTKRQEMFANAYKVVVSWKEMLYKIRRRDNSKKMDSQIIREFHQLQKKMDFYQGLLSAESKALGLSYKEFILGTKKETGSLIHAAWKIKGKNPKSDDHAKEVHPNIEKYSDIFLKDIRNWLSWFLFPKLLVLHRNIFKPWLEKNKKEI